jgi:hypothetical protein
MFRMSIGGRGKSCWSRAWTVSIPLRARETETADSSFATTLTHGGAGRLVAVMTPPGGS